MYPFRSLSNTLSLSRVINKSAALALDLPQNLKRFIVLVTDICLCILATWLAFYLRLDEWVDLERVLKPLTLSIIVAVPIFMLAGLYRIIFRYSDSAAFRSIGIALASYTLVFLPIISIFTLAGTPRTVGILQPLILFFGVALTRLFARVWLGRSYLSRIRGGALPKALIYGAGFSGRQLSSALIASHQARIAGFIDDDVILHKRLVNGIKVFPPSEMTSLIEHKGIDQVLLAIPGATRTRRRQIVDSLSNYRLTIRTLPSLADLATGRFSINDLKDLDINDLLGREPVKADPALLTQKIENKNVMVTGAGGSIGGELCRQILKLDPKRLLLLESSEYALYNISAELNQWLCQHANEKKSEIIPLICSVRDEERIDMIFSKWSPDTVFHAAAYKHVPLVEYNVAEGIKNNILGTLNVVHHSIKYGTFDFVLISTDKAVRPTNVMGATKRIAEMILQALWNNGATNTRLSMVRFGNVLGSSGSVIPKFQTQIRDGGPVTVTHPDVTRYFMTIPEAAQLVIQAAALSRGGEVFVLEMGEPVKILELAQRMISLSGLSEKTADNPDGDIEIAITGLRHGEKLYEELLIGDNVESTLHPRIMRADERFVDWLHLDEKLKELEGRTRENDIDGIFEILDTLVDGFKRNGEIVDLTNCSSLPDHLI